MMKFAVKNQRALIKKTPLPTVGFEPTIFRLEVERVIHCATRVSKYIINELFIFFHFLRIDLFDLEKIFLRAECGDRTHGHALKRRALYRLS